MLRKSVFSVFSFIAIVILISCNPCNHLDCNVRNYHVQFRIVSKTDGKDLVLGPNAMYDKSKIKFFSLNGTDSNFYDYQPILSNRNGYDSILSIYFFPKAISPVYMKLNNTDIDTFLLYYNSFDAKCCGNITEITQFKCNYSTDIRRNKGIQEIRK